MLAGDHLRRSRWPAPARSGSARRPPITSTRPGCMTGSAARSSRGHRAAADRPARGSASAVITEPWIAAGPIARSGRATIAAIVVTVPATPTKVAASVDRHVDPGRRRSRPRCRPGRRRPGRRSAGRRCRCRSVSRTQPMSMLCDRQVVGAGRRSPSTSSVEPPPMSATSSGAGDRAEPAGRAGERQRRLGRARRSPRARCRAPNAPSSTKSARLAASRVALVATIRTASAPDATRSAPAYSTSAIRVRSIAAGSRRPVRSTPSPSRTIRISRDQIDQRRRPAPGLGDQQPDRVGAAVDAGYAHGPSVHHGGSCGQRFVAERVDARARPRGCARPARAGTSPGSACRRR